MNDAWHGGAELPLRQNEAAAQSHRPARPKVLTFVALGGEGKTSLVAKWAADLAAQDWPGCDAVFAWSFYSQGTREQTAVSSDLFLAEALTFFGDAAMAGSAQGAHEKGKRLAELIGQRRSLLILDGLEPLQYAPTSPTPGELKDQGLGALLKGLAANSHGLCVVTTRYALPDLRAFHGRTVREEKLARLARDAGVQLLKAHGVTGSDRRNLPLHDGDAKSELVSEFEKLVEDVDGHALTLHIMGSFLKKAFGGDIRKRDRVTFAKASQKTDNDHAFRAMAAYARWMEDGSDEARRELAILRLMGLFDRPATADCLAALLAVPAIPGLTEPLTGLPEEDWNCSLESLVAAKLLSVTPETVSVPASAFPLPASLDAHPLIREYFAERLKNEDKRMKAEGSPTSSFIPQPSSFQLAHRRLYEHLCATTKEGDQPTLEALQPLYQAVAHGCQAGLQQEAWEEVFLARVIRQNEKYSKQKLGAFASDLGAVTCFFDLPWKEVSSEVAKFTQALLLDEAAFALRALGRLTEALETMRASRELLTSQGDLNNAAAQASNLSELDLTLGEVAGAVGDAEQSVTYADRRGDDWQMFITSRTTHADALHQAGRRAEAETCFREAEQMQKESGPAYPLLYSVRGFRYCDLILAAPERAAWQALLGGAAVLRRPTGEFEACRAVSQRAAQTLKWMEDDPGAPVLTLALDHLTLGRAALYAGILDSPNFNLRTLISEIDAAVSGLRRAGQAQELPRGLLTRAWLRILDGKFTGPESAQEDLDEAWEIAERGPMKLHMADIHLYRARLFGSAKSEAGSRKYPWESPAADLAAAEAIIRHETTYTRPDRTVICARYARRDDELADAKRALLVP